MDSTIIIINCIYFTLFIAGILFVNALAKRKEKIAKKESEVKRQLQLDRLGEFNAALKILRNKRFKVYLEGFVDDKGHVHISTVKISER